MSDTDPIGRVIATERDPTTTGHVRFWLASDVHLKPFDFVRIVSPEDATRDTGHFYAIIHEIFQVSDEPSVSSNLNIRVYGLELAARVVDFHLPVDTALVVVDVARPRRDFVA